MVVGGGGWSWSCCGRHTKRNWRWMVFINGSVGCTGKELGANGTGEQEPRKLGPPSRMRGLLCRQSASKALDAKPGGKHNAQRRHVCKPWGAARRAEVGPRA